MFNSFITCARDEVDLVPLAYEDDVSADIKYHCSAKIDGFYRRLWGAFSRVTF